MPGHAFPVIYARDVERTEPRFERFVCVDDVDRQVDELRRAGVPVLREPQDMPWGERPAFVADPEGNPVTLAAGPGQA